MASAPQQIGAETRASILPTEEPKGVGFLGPDYNYADQIVPPQAIGVRREGTFSAVMDGIRGVSYYIDTIGFGESSNFLTRDLPFIRYGTNYFLKTGMKCSNGADMWQYMELIPRGDAFGEKVRQAVAGIGIAELRGLAPGMIEDTKAAMDPSPIMKAMMGSGYPQCKLVTLPVGDELGRIQGEKGDPWVDDKQSVFYRGGRAYQTKWILDKMVDKKTFDATKKTMNPDGTPANQKVPIRETFTDEGAGAAAARKRWLLYIAGAFVLGNIWAASA